MSSSNIQQPSSLNNNIAYSPPLSPTLQEVEQFAKTIPLPPSREPSLSPSASFSESRRAAAVNAALASLTAASSTPSTSHSPLLSKRKPSYTSADDKEQTTDISPPTAHIRERPRTFHPRLAPLSRDSPSNSRDSISLSSSLGSPSKLAERIHHRKSLGFLGSSRTSPRKDLLASLGELSLESKRSRKRSFDDLGTDHSPVLPAVAVHVPHEMSREPSPPLPSVRSRTKSLADNKRREESPFLPNLEDTSLLDSSFMIPSIGDKTYDELEVAAEVNRVRRKSLGLPRARSVRSVKSSFSSLSATSAASEESATTPPQSASIVPLTMRRSPPARLTIASEGATRTPLRAQASVLSFDKNVLSLKKSTIFTNAGPEMLDQDSESFQLTPPGSAQNTPAGARRTPIRPQPSVPLFEAKVALKKSTIFNHAVDPETLVGDSESFQLTPPSSVRVPGDGQTPSRTPLSRVQGRTPRSLLASRAAPLPPSAAVLAEQDEDIPTPTKKADMTFDLKALLKTGRPKRPSGTEESFLAVGADAVDLADLSADEGDTTISPIKNQLIPDELRPKETVRPAASTKSASLASLNERGLPVEAPSTESSDMPRSQTSRTISDSKRTSLASASSRLAPSSSMRSLVGLARGIATPRRAAADRADVPLTMRRNAVPAPAAVRPAATSMLPPAETDRWADAIERDPTVISSTAAVAAPVERRLPGSVSSRRLSTAPSGGITRSGSTRTALNIAERPGLPRSASTRTVERPASGSGTAPLPRVGSSRLADRAPSRESNPGLVRTNSTRSNTGSDTGSATGRTAASSRVSAPPATTPAAPRSSLAARTSLAPRASLAPRTSLAPVAAAPAAPRRSLLPPPRTKPAATAPTSTGTSTISRLSARLSSRPSLAPRARPFGDAAPATNRPAASTLSGRKSMAVPPSPVRDAPERGLGTLGAAQKRFSTPATVTGRRSLAPASDTVAGRQSTLAGAGLPTLNEFGMPAPARGMRTSRPSTINGRR